MSDTRSRVVRGVASVQEGEAFVADLEDELNAAQRWRTLTDALERSVTFRIAGVGADWTPTAMLAALQGVVQDFDALNAHVHPDSRPL